MTDNVIDVKDLQRALATVDLRSGRTGSDISFLVIRLSNLKVKMYQERGHELPHVHIDYGHQLHTASYSINPPQRLAGRLSGSYDRDVCEWIAKNKVDLLKLWAEAQSGGSVEVLIASLNCSERT